MQARAENFAPYSMAALLHLLIAASLVVSFSFSTRDSIETPLAITGALIADATRLPPPAPVEEPEIVPEPIPEPIPEPVVDTSEQDRIAAEEAKRAEDARIERERQAEIKRQEDAAREKRLAEEKAAREAETERRRVEAERIRQEEIERQRAENERLRLEAEAEARQAELDAEAEAIEQATASARDAYIFALTSRVKNRWAEPPSFSEGQTCSVDIRQSRSGEVLSANIRDCSADAVVRRSIEAAVQQASPLPTPRDPSLFLSSFTIKFVPTPD